MSSVLSSSPSCPSSSFAAVCLASQTSFEMSQLPSIGEVTKFSSIAVKSFKR